MSKPSVSCERQLSTDWLQELPQWKFASWILHFGYCPSLVFAEIIWYCVSDQWTCQIHECWEWLGWLATEHAWKRGVASWQSFFQLRFNQINQNVGLGPTEISLNRPLLWGRSQKDAIEMDRWGRLWQKLWHQIKEWGVGLSQKTTLLGKKGGGLGAVTFVQPPFF